MSIPANPWPMTARHWLYDEIMRQVEPDLMFERIPLLEKKYMGESEEQRTARLLRYEDAFKRFDQLYAQAAEQYVRETHQLKEEARKVAMQTEYSEHEQDLTRIEHLFQSSDA